MAEKQKLYAYVDETGQDTQDVMFLVSVVVAGETRDAARRALQDIECYSSKRAKKWTRARVTERVADIDSASVERRSLAQCITPTTATHVPMLTS
jgi:hypothetical protein